MSPSMPENGHNVNEATMNPYLKSSNRPFNFSGHLSATGTIDTVGTDDPSLSAKVPFDYRQTQSSFGPLLTAHRAGFLAVHKTTPLPRSCGMTYSPMCVASGLSLSIATLLKT